MMTMKIKYRLNDFVERFEMDEDSIYTDEIKGQPLCEPILDASATTEDLMDELLYLLWLRTIDSDFYIYQKEYDIDHHPELTDLTRTDWQVLARRLVNIWNMTHDRYIPLLTSYKANETDPMPQLHSSSEGKTRFNDTPQSDDLDDGYYATDGHASNVTASKSESAADSGTIAERLDELYKNWRSILKDWLDEFNGLLMVN